MDMNERESKEGKGKERKEKGGENLIFNNTEGIETIVREVDKTGKERKGKGKRQKGRGRERILMVRE